MLVLVVLVVFVPLVLKVLLDAQLDVIFCQTLKVFWILSSVICQMLTLVLMVFVPLLLEVQTLIILVLIFFEDFVSLDLEVLFVLIG